MATEVLGARRHRRIAWLLAGALAAVPAIAMQAQAQDQDQARAPDPAPAAVREDRDAPELGACRASRITLSWLSSKRPETINDLMASWVGDRLPKLVGAWGAPDSTFDNRDGTRILTWKDEWGGCTQTFLVDGEDIVSKWSYSGCKCFTESGRRSPKSTPIPRMTL